MEIENYHIARKTKYFGYLVQVVDITTLGTELYCYRIKFEDGWHTFTGAPNKTYTARAALKRAWYRCKWWSEGNHPYN